MSLYDDLKPGDKLRTLFGNTLDCTYHVRGRVDGLLILREWSRGKQRWMYSVRGREWFYTYEPHLKITRPKGYDTK